MRPAEDETWDPWQLSGAYEVGGLVGFTARGGSSPIERMEKPCTAGLFALRAASSRLATNNFLRVEG
jgi:hypothetical protein